MSFIDTMKKEYEDSRQDLSNTSTSSSKALPKLDEKTSKDLQDKIQKNAELIQELKDVQNERLSSTPPVHFSNISKPNDREQELASVIRTNLVEMAGKVKPYHVTSERNIRKAMGTSKNLPLSSTNTANTMQPVPGSLERGTPGIVNIDWTSRRFSVAAGPREGPKYGCRMASRAEILFFA